MRLIRLVAAACCGLLAHEASPQAQTPATQPAQLPWATKLGLRALQVSQAVKLVDRVVLVPDAATYVDEIAKWSPQGRWPVLFEDDLYAPMFVRRFAPAELIRREPVKTPLAEDVAQRRRLLESIVVGAVGGDRAAQSVREACDAVKYVPPGVVVASTSDPSWTAAVALAAGHVQPLIWLDDRFDGPNGALDDAVARRLAGAIDAAVEGLGYSFRTLGDDIDAITLCGNYPVAAQLNLPEAQRLIKSGQYADGPVAFSDFVGRNADASRYAFTGWIFGDEKRCAYMAMCSLFLRRENLTLLNAYSNDGEWGLYGMNGAAEILASAELTAVSRAGENEMGVQPWMRMLVGGVTADSVWMNSGGNNDFFILVGGQARACDVPVLNQPTALHLIHSWSMQAPGRSDTVGGRWLNHGAYAAVGSCHEPFLSAFVPPRSLAARCTAAMPLLVSARRWAEDGQSLPWRVATIGDPLMLIPPAKAPIAQRVAQPADYGENLHERVKTLMRQADAEGSVEAFVEAIRILDMLGRDEIAVQMWRLAQQKNIPSGRIAAAVLPALFRRADLAGYLQAWNEGGPRSPILFDMLWHLAGARLDAGGPADRVLLETLEMSVRMDMPAPDVERLTPALLRAFGKDRAQQFLQRVIGQAGDAEQQRQLRAIAGRF